MKIKQYILIAIIALTTSIAVAQQELKTEQENLSILQSDAALFDKARACEQLSIVGTRESVGVLAGLLGDEQLSDYARFALEPIDDNSVDKVFRDALGKVSGRKLAGVISSIGARGDTKAVGGLKKLVYNTKSGVSADAIAALGRIASDDAIEIIVKALSSGPVELRIPAAEACLAAGQQLLMRNKTEKALALYNSLAKADVADHLTSAATYGSIITRGEAGLGLLIEQLKSDDSAMVEVALLAARKLPGTKVTKSLAAELPSMQPKVQVLLIKALLDRNDPTIVDLIESLATSDNPNVREEALKALGQIGNASSISMLLKASGGSDSESEIALSSLRTITAEGIDQEIIHGMTAAKGQLKAELIDIIAARRFRAAMPALLREAASKDEIVAITALKAISDMARPQDLNPLVALLVHIDSNRVRSQGEITVAAVALNTQDKSIQSNTVIEKLNSTKDTEVRCSLLRVLGRIGNGKALQALQNALEDNDESIRDTAIRALATCTNTDALDTLMQISSTSTNDTHRTLSLRGYIRLLGVDSKLSQKAKAGMYANAMSKVAGDDDKKLVLAGLANVSHPDALGLITGFINDPAVRNEAVYAALKVTQLTAGAEPGKAKSAAMKILENATSPEIKKQAQAIVKAIEGFDDFIVAWKVTGPYTEAHRDHNTLLWMALGPEMPNNEIKWSLMPAATDPDRPWILDLLRLYPGDNRVAYVKTWVHSEKEQNAVLEMGSDDGVKAWLNGKLIHNHSIARAAIPGSDKKEIALKKGWNLLMLKISQNVSGWEFCAKISKAEGIKVDCFYEEQSNGQHGISIFDGKTFAGWEGNLDIFRIHDGAIVGGTLKDRIARNEFLCTKIEYSDFEMRLKVKLLGDNANAGIQIRSRRIPDHHEIIGYQADMGQHYWGCLYDESRRNKVLAGPDKAEIEKVLKAGEWNDYVIRCQGKQIQLWINGFQTVDFTEEDASIEQAGLIGLQIHGGGPSEAWYKDITIEEF